jgi:hypothetical protein
VTEQAKAQTPIVKQGDTLGVGTQDGSVNIVIQAGQLGLLARLRPVKARELAAKLCQLADEVDANADTAVAQVQKKFEEGL